MAVLQLAIIKKLEEEIRIMEHELRSELPKEIQKARELGDLSENAEYSAVKERQSLLGNRLAKLTTRLGQLRMVDMSRIPKDAIGLGSTVVLYELLEDREVTYELVTSEETDVSAGKISTTSPIGRALLGKRDGDVVIVNTPGGRKEFEVLKLETIYSK